MLRAIVEHVLVDFVGDEIRIPSHAKIADRFDLSTRKNFPRRIIRRIENDSLRRGAKRRGQFLRIETPLGGLQLDEARRCTGKNRVRSIIFIERLEDHHFIARIDDRHHRGHHGFSRAAANGDFAFGINLDSLHARKFLGDGIAEFFPAPGDSVLIDVHGNGLPRRLFDFLRRGEIGKALREIDGAVLQRQPRHFANHGFGELRDFMRKPRTAFGAARLRRAHRRYPRAGAGACFVARFVTAGGAAPEYSRL